MTFYHRNNFIPRIKHASVASKIIIHYENVNMSKVIYVSKIDILPVYCGPGYVYLVKNYNNSLFMVYTERRFGVSCSVHTDAKGYIIMGKLVKLAFCLCYIDTFPDKT